MPSDYRRKWYERNKAKALKQSADWYAANKERKLAAGRRWSEKNRERLNARRVELRKTNPQRARERARRHYWNHRDGIVAKQRLKRAKNRKVRTYRPRDPHKVKARNARYLKRHPDKNASKSARQRAVRKKATPRGANEQLIISFYAIAARVSRCLRIPHDVDHIKPIARGGLHHQNNLQVLPAVINRRKGSKIAPS